MPCGNSSGGGASFNPPQGTRMILNRRSAGGGLSLAMLEKIAFTSDATRRVLVMIGL